MRLQILTLLCSLLVLVLATGKLEDRSNIEDVLNAFNFFVDSKKFSKIDKIYARDVIYDAGPGVAPFRPVRGIPAVQKSLEQTVPEKAVSYSQLTTKLIKFVPPYDKDGRSDRAEAVSYNVYTFFGAGNSTGETFFLFIRYVDKEIVRTKEPGFGGWRIKNRKVELVGKPIGNPAVLEE